MKVELTPIKLLKPVLAQCEGGLLAIPRGSNLYISARPTLKADIGAEDVDEVNEILDDYQAMEKQYGI